MKITRKLTALLCSSAMFAAATIPCSAGVGAPEYMKFSLPTIEANPGETVQVSTIGVYDEVLRDAGGLSDVNVTEEEEPEEEEIVFEWEKTKEEPQPGPEAETPEETQQPEEGE